MDISIARRKRIASHSSTGRDHILTNAVLFPSIFPGILKTNILEKTLNSSCFKEESIEESQKSPLTVK